MVASDNQLRVHINSVGEIEVSVPLTGVVDPSLLTKMVNAVCKGINQPRSSEYSPHAQQQTPQIQSQQNQQSSQSSLPSQQTQEETDASVSNSTSHTASSTKSCSSQVHTPTFRKKSVKILSNPTDIEHSTSISPEKNDGENDHFNQAEQEEGNMNESISKGDTEEEPEPQKNHNPEDERNDSETFAEEDENSNSNLANVSPIRNTRGSKTASKKHDLESFHNSPVQPKHTPPKLHSRSVLASPSPILSSLPHTNSSSTKVYFDVDEDLDKEENSQFEKEKDNVKGTPSPISTPGTGSSTTPRTTPIRTDTTNTLILENELSSPVVLHPKRDRSVRQVADELNARLSSESPISPDVSNRTLSLSSQAPNSDTGNTLNTNSASNNSSHRITASSFYDSAREFSSSPSVRLSVKPLVEDPISDESKLRSQHSGHAGMNFPASVSESGDVNDESSIPDTDDVYMKRGGIRRAIAGKVPASSNERPKRFGNRAKTEIFVVKTRREDASASGLVSQGGPMRVESLPVGMKLGDVMDTDFRVEKYSSEAYGLHASNKNGTQIVDVQEQQRGSRKDRHRERQHYRTLSATAAEGGAYQQSREDSMLLHSSREFNQNNQDNNTVMSSRRPDLDTNNLGPPSTSAFVLTGPGASLGVADLAGNDKNGLGYLSSLPNEESNNMWEEYGGHMETDLSDSFQQDYSRDLSRFTGVDRSTTGANIHAPTATKMTRWRLLTSISTKINGGSLAPQLPANNNNNCRQDLSSTSQRRLRPAVNQRNGGIDDIHQGTLAEGVPDYTNEGHKNRGGNGRMGRGLLSPTTWFGRNPVKNGELWLEFTSSLGIEEMLGEVTKVARSYGFRVLRRLGENKLKCIRNLNHRQEMHMVIIAGSIGLPEGPMTVVRLRRGKGDRNRTDSWRYSHFYRNLITNLQGFGIDISGGPTDSFS